MKPAFNVGGRSDIYIGPAGELLGGVLPAGRIVALSDTTVARCCGELLAPYECVLIGTGERNKTLRTVETVYRRFIELGVDRRTFVLAVGGGIVTDVAGFAAATYMRGVAFGFVPTTLLGQVDAAVGGKNGVNVDGYKNMAGTFTQPQLVICDPALLRTLPDREFRAGLAEVVKAAVIADADLFASIAQSTFGQLRSDAELLADVVAAAVRVKTDIVGRDERERGERRKLNLGHTLAHAIEKCSPAMNHGEAVAVGTALIADAAVRLGVLSDADRVRIRELLARLGFDLTPPVAMPLLLKEVVRDKKSEDGLRASDDPRGLCRPLRLTVRRSAPAFGMSLLLPVHAICRSAPVAGWSLLPVGACCGVVLLPVGACCGVVLLPVGARCGVVPSAGRCPFSSCLFCRPASSILPAPAAG